MPIEAAVAFDRSKDFSKFLADEPIGAVRWLNTVFRHGAATGELPGFLARFLADQPAAERLLPHLALLEKAGRALSVPVAGFAPDELRSQGVAFPERPPVPMLRGTVRLVPTTRELGMRMVLVTGQREFPLVCNDEALESFAGDLSAFAGAYDVALTGWPDTAGQIFVEEAAPVLNLPGLAWNDWAQGRLFDNGT